MFDMPATSADAADSGKVRSLSLGRVVALLLSALVGAGLWALLRRGLFEGQAQSYDAPLYVRSLWGIAHGDYNNSLIDYPSLTIHTQSALLVLAPLARVWHAADVLIAAQACTVAGTLFVWLSAMLRARRAKPAGTLLLASWACLLFLYGMPLVANPFVFDVRPEIIGVLFATVGLMRSAERQHFDATAVVFLLLSAAAREEFALVAACALTLSPVARTGPGWSLRARMVTACVLVLYGLCNSYFWSRDLAQAAHLNSDASWPDLALAKLQLTAAFVASGGGLAALGYRWLGSALPGLGLLAVSTWMAKDQVSFHYGMFVAPALLTASYAGYASLSRRSQLPRAWLGAHVAFALASAAWLSALPGGARFASQHFDLQGSLLAPATWRAHTGWLAEAHRILQSVPHDRSLLLQYVFAAPYADRVSIRVLEVDNAKPWQPDAVFLPQNLWATRGAQLREQGYRLAGLAGSSFALMSRRASVPLAHVLSADGCEDASVSWPDAGLQLCNAWIDPDGRVTVLLGRTGSHGAALGPRLELSAGPQVTTTLLPLDGLIELTDLPTGRVAWSKSQRAVPNPNVTFTLFRADGRIIPLSVQGKLKDRISLTLLPPR
jgi:uncharacterized membrane protein